MATRGKTPFPSLQTIQVTSKFPKFIQAPKVSPRIPLDVFKTAWTFSRSVPTPHSQLNSPGQRPTACQILSTSPCSRFPVLRITGLQDCSPVWTPLGVLVWEAWTPNYLPLKIDPETDSEFDRLLEPTGLQIRSKSINSRSKIRRCFRYRFQIDF